MAKKKYYAVQVGKIPGIYGNAKHKQKVFLAQNINLFHR